MATRTRWIFNIHSALCRHLPLRWRTSRNDSSNCDFLVTSEKTEFARYIVLIVVCRKVKQKLRSVMDRKVCKIIKITKSSVRASSDSLIIRSTMHIDRLTHAIIYYRLRIIDSSRGRIKNYVSRDNNVDVRRGRANFHVSDNVQQSKAR